MPVDIVFAGPGLEDLFFEHVTMRDIEGLAIPLASAEDIIVMKVLAGRPKDLDDARAVASTKRRSLSEAQIRETITLLEEALGQSDLSTKLDEVLLPAKRRKKT